MDGVTETVWADILAQLRIRHPDLVRGWFSQLVPLRLDQGVLEISAINASQQAYLTENCLRPFVEAAQAATARLVTVRFMVPPEQEPERRPPETVITLPPEQDPDQVPLNPRHVFDEFVVGPCNRLAHAACVAVSEAAGKAYNPLFVHGCAGMGKTHLLQATCHRIQELQPQAKVLYLTCEAFMNHFIQAVERGAMHTFRYRYRHVDVLVIDDIQFLAARERGQEEFFHTFNTLYQLQKQIILSSDSPPSEIPSLEERLVSRFTWGLVARLDLPCFDTRLAIIHKKSKALGLDLPDEVSHFIAGRMASNTRELEGAILTIHALTSQINCPIDLNIVRQALGDQDAARHAPVTIANILEAVTNHFSVRLADIQSRKRSKSIALPRQVCMYLARTMTDHSLEEIGGYFGGRDHSTVLHAARTVASLQESDPGFRIRLQEITASLQR